MIRFEAILEIFCYDLLVLKKLSKFLNRNNVFHKKKRKN